MANDKTLTAVVELAGKISPELVKSLKDAEKKFGKLDKSVKLVNKSLAAMGTVAVTAIGAMGTYLLKSGNDYIRTMNDMSAQTGLTGEKLQEVETIARNIYKSGLGENFQEIADALVNIKQASGLAGEELEKAAKSGLLLKDTFDFEINESTRAASALMKNFGISAEEAYGIIATGAQQGANKNGDLLDTLNEYSVHYKALGLDADQFITSLIAGAEAGSFSIDKVGDAVKEFTIRSKDGSKSSIEAFEAIGLNAKTMTAAFSMGGETAEKAFFKTIQALDAMQDPMAKNAAGVALFGTMFEDLESGVLKTLGNMNGANVDAAETLKQIEKIKYKDIGYALTEITRTLGDKLMPIAEKVGLAVYEYMPQIRESMDKITPAVEAFAAAVAAGFPYVLDLVLKLFEVVGFLAENLDILIPIIAGVVGGLASFSIINSVIALMNMWKATTIATTLANGGLVAALKAVWLAMTSNPIGWIAIGIGALIAVVVALVKNWDKVTAAAQKFWEILKGFGSFIKDHFIDILLGALGPLGTIINGIRKITGLKSSTKATEGIPAYATGGFTDGLSIAGEAGTEAIISFDKAYRNKNIDIWEKAGQLLGVSSSGSSIDMGGLTINFEVNGSQNPENIVNAIKNNIHDVVDELVDEIDRRTSGSYGVQAYTG